MGPSLINAKCLKGEDPEVPDRCLTVRTLISDSRPKAQFENSKSKEKRKD